MTSTNQLAEEQLAYLRARVREVRLAKKWLQEYRLEAPASVSSALGAYFAYLDRQEKKAIAMGMKISNEYQKKFY